MNCLRPWMLFDRSFVTVLCMFVCVILCRSLCKCTVLNAFDTPSAVCCVMFTVNDSEVAYCDHSVRYIVFHGVFVFLATLVLYTIQKGL